MLNLLDIFFPKKCVGCNKSGLLFCLNCISEIKQTNLVCPFCEKPSIGGFTHPICKRRFGLDGLWSLGLYEDPLRKAIQKLKYKYIKDYSEELVNLLLDYWVQNPPLILDIIKKDRGQGWIITGVPLHWQRQNWRGFNQSELIGSLLASRIGLDYQNLLTRTKKTTPQVRLKGYERKQNIKNAFKVTTSPELITHNIILIDDVWTTGSTLKECTYILKRNGAKSVYALTIAS